MHSVVQRCSTHNPIHKGEIMGIKRFLVTGLIGVAVFIGLAFAVHKPAHAQVSTGQQPQFGKYVELEIDHITCVAIKRPQLPTYYVTRTNRPDLFFEHLGTARTCLARVKSMMDNPTKYKWSFKDLQPIHTGPGPGSRMGGMALISCVELITQNGAGKHTVGYEFAFPYFKESELPLIVHETQLRMCLEKADEVTEVPMRVPDYTRNNAI